MRTPIELRNDAWECLQQAQQAEGSRDKAILLILAQGWASLADEMERLVKIQDDDVGPIEPAGDDTARERPATN
jgi:hypothetical protein